MVQFKPIRYQNFLMTEISYPNMVWHLSQPIVLVGLFLGSFQGIAMKNTLHIEYF